MNGGSVKATPEREKRPEPISSKSPTLQPTPSTGVSALQARVGNAALAAASGSGSVPPYGESFPSQSTFGNALVARTFSRGGEGIQAKLARSSPDDSLEREADRVADLAVKGGHSPPRLASTTTARTVQRQEVPTEKPHEPPTKFPPQEEAKHGREKDEEKKEKLIKGGLKAAGEFARRLWDEFSSSQSGKNILAAIEKDWKPILKFFEDFASTTVGKIIFGAAAGGATTGAFLGARSAREASGASGVAPGGPSAPLAPKDEKFFALQLKWDFVSPPAGFTLKTPWLDLPTIGGGSSSSSSTFPPPTPQPFIGITNSAHLYAIGSGRRSGRSRSAGCFYLFLAALEATAGKGALE